jgi:hypothetical protein
MSWWFDRWVSRFEREAQETERRTRTAAEEALSRAARDLLEALQQEMYRAVPIGPGTRFRTDSGRVFAAVAHRAVLPGEFHFCGGQIRIMGRLPWTHVCWVLIEIEAPPPPPRSPRQTTPGDRLARHLRTLGFKKAEHPTAAEVRARYIDLAKRYHPDVNPRGAERMKRITEAYRNYQEMSAE